MRGFKIVDNDKRKHPENKITLPTRGTSKAMAYDFYAPTNYIIQPGETVKIWTDITAYMKDDEGLILNVRSSQGGKFILANTQGWIDCDYTGFNIGVFLTNISDNTQTIKQGDRIAQGMFINYLTADTGNTDNIRTGGFGSTD